MDAAFSMRDVVKTYPGFTLGPLNLELEPGIVLGMIGPNGAGKTTTINMLAGLIRPKEGEIRIHGIPADPNDASWKLGIGYVGDNPTFYERWSGERNLQFVSSFYPSWSDERARELAERFDLDLKKKARTLSRGNRVKLALVMALAHNPKLCLFDEPTSGLDPVVRNEVLEVLWDMMSKGEAAILYSTHILSDIGRLADDLVFLQKGKLSPRIRKDDLVEAWRRISFRHTGEPLELEGVVSYAHEGPDNIVISRDSPATLNALKQVGVTAGEVSRLTLDEISIHILKGNGRVEFD